MNRIEFRQYRESDLEEVTRLLNRSLEFDQFATDWVAHKVTGDPDYDPEQTWVGVQGGGVIAFIQGIVRTTGDDAHGCIKMLAVDARHRGCGIAGRLLDKLEAVFLQRQVEARVLFSRPNYFMPGLDPRYTPAASLFLSRGYERIGEGFNMSVELTPGSPAGFLIRTPEGGTGSSGELRILRPDLQERDRVTRWLDRTGVSHSWNYQALHAFNRQEREPGKGSGLLIAEMDGEWVGFAAHGAVLPGWFGPEWVRSDYRGRGIGKALLLAALRDMRDEGYDRCEIGLVGPLPFYAKAVGATVSRTWWFLRRKFV